MDFKTNKTSVTLAASTVLLLIGNSLFITPFANATSNDECGEKFTYEKSNDYDDNRVVINFESNDDQIDVTAKSGYKINKVWLDVENDGHSGYFQYASGPLNNFNPNPGNDISEAKVEVEKDCVDSGVCAGGDNSWVNDWYKDEHSAFNVTAPSGYTIDQVCVKGGQNKITYTTNGSDGCWSVSGIGSQTASAIKVGSGSSCKDISHASFHRVRTATQTPSPTVTTTPTVTPTITVTVTPTTTVTPTVTNQPTVTPTDTPSVTPSVTVTDTPTTTPTDTVTPTVTTTETPTESQNSSSNNNNNSSNNNSSNNATPTDSVQGAQAQTVLGTSIMAKTGTFVNTVMNLLTATGMMVMALGAISYAKEKKA